MKTLPSLLYFDSLDGAEDRGRVRGSGRLDPSDERGVVRLQTNDRAYHWGSNFAHNSETDESEQSRQGDICDEGRGLIALRCGLREAWLSHLGGKVDDGGRAHLLLLPSTMSSAPYASPPGYFSPAPRSSPDTFTLHDHQARLPIYPLLLLLVHFLLAINIDPSAHTLRLPLFFLVFTVALVIVSDLLLIKLGKPKSRLEFVLQRWTAHNVHLVSWTIVAGFMVLPPDGEWTEARASWVGVGGFVLCLMAGLLNAS